MGRLPRGWASVRAEAVIGGDARSLAIAAASVVAKEVRDRLMRRLDRRYPQYGFARHKGYATADHRQAVPGVPQRPRCQWQAGPHHRGNGDDRRRERPGDRAGETG